MNNIKLVHAMKHDALFGFVMRWKSFTFSVVLFLSVIFMFHLYTVNYVQAVGSNAKYGFFDLLIVFFWGNEPVEYDVAAAGFNGSGIPVSMVWLCFFCYLSYMVGYYTRDDLKINANNCLLRIGSKEIWWVSKCIWCVMTVVILYGLLLLCILLFVFGFGDLRSSFHPELMVQYNGCDLTPGSEPSLLLISFILPLVTSVVISLVQICISIYIKPIFCFFFSLVYLLCASYFSHPLLIYNYTMICRNKELGDGGSIILMMLASVFFVVLLGCKFIRYKDFI